MPTSELRVVTEAKPRCRLCGSVRTVKVTKRLNKDFELVQAYRCLRCGTNFQAGRGYHKWYPQEMVVAAVKAYRSGMTAAEVQEFLRKQFPERKTFPSTNPILQWAKRARVKVRPSGRRRG